MMDKYYVYQYVDPRTNKPFYIGKGEGKRYLRHLTETKDNTENYKKWAYIQGLRNKGLEPIVEKIQENMTQDAAYNLETILIKKYGRKGIDEDGILTNILLDARPPCAKGRTISEEHKTRISVANSGKNNAMSGLKWFRSEDGKKSFSEKMSGENNPFYGKTHSKEQKEKWKNMERGMSGKKHSKKTKEKMSKTQTGKPVSEETKKKISKTLTGREQSEETKKKRSETIKQWWKKRKEKS